MKKPVMMGIDISHWQGNVNFQTVKAQGFDFVIIRAGAGNANGVLYKDERFEDYYAAAVSAGLHVGAYFYASGQFHKAGRGATEAAYFARLITGKQFDFPVALDVECSPAGYAEITTDNAITFCDYLERLGYYVTIYASDLSGFKSRLDLSSLVAYDKWVARYNSTGPQYVKDYGMWQFGGSTNYLRNIKVPGVSSAACDQDYAYKDYPSIIKAAGLNGYKNGNTPATGVKLYKFTSGSVTAGDLEQYKELAEKQGVPYNVQEVNEQ